MLSKLGDRLSAFFRATAPDPFVIAVLLTLLTFILVLAMTDAAPRDIVSYWSGSAGVWAFLTFSMQMCLILVTGHALASSPPVAAIIKKLADLPRSAPQAVMLVALVAALLGILNWGLGLIGGALIARDVGRAMHRRGITVHYPLLAAAGYVGLMVWHGGFSGSAPITMTTTDQIERTFKASLPNVAPISLSETLFSPLNLVTTLGLVALAVIIMPLLHPKGGQRIDAPNQFIPCEDPPRPARDQSPFDNSEAPKPFLPRLLEDTPIVNLILVALIAWWAFGYYFPRDLSTSGIFSLTPDTINLTMLMLGLILHVTPRRYVAAVEEAARGCAGIILQFPLYAGIMGMMHSSGLTAQLAHVMASTTNQTTLPIFTFFSAAIVNLFVPSGGGQWGIQGPIALQAAADAGVSPAKMVMSVAYGDQLTNMLQPFWALPLLALTRVKARDIVGYTAILMIAGGVWIVVCLFVF